jgi:hypothetical protein
MNNKHDAEPPALIDYRHRFAPFLHPPPTDLPLALFNACLTTHCPLPPI